MISLMSIIAAILSFMTLFLIFTSKNFIYRTLAMLCFICMLPVVFGSFVMISGEPRIRDWDFWWNPPSQMEIISWTRGEEEVYLWLKRSDGTPIYYAIEDPNGEKAKKLKEEEKTAKRNQGKLYFRFHDGKGDSKNPSENVEEFSNLDSEFFAIFPPGVPEAKQEEEFDPLSIDRTDEI